MNGRDLYESRSSHKGVIRTPWDLLDPEWRANWGRRLRELARSRRRCKFKGPAQPRKKAPRARVAIREAERRNA